MQRDSIDLMNVDYEDVLHLYRGWRKSENLLKDKDKELSSLKVRVKQLQDSHQQFRSQINALESVKELTVTLQSELTTLQQENKQLFAENQELVQLNLQAEELLKEKDVQEHDQSKLLKNVQLEFATLKGRYEETLKIQKELEKLATDEQAARMSLESRLSQADHTIEQLKEENRSLKMKLETANHKLQQCDQELLHASEQLSSISKELIQINNTKEALATSQAENGVLRGDIARLVRLLEYSPATKEFIDQWQTSEGMHFAGLDPSSVTRGSGSFSGNHLDMTGAGVFDSTYYDGPETPGELESKYDLSPTEFAQLKRVYGRDPFPMTSTYADESEYWVPKEAARLGLNFLTARLPHASPQVIMEFLRTMNKIWLRRERRKVKKVKEVLGSTIEDLKRQLSHLKPYKGVIAEKQIKRLKSQVKESRSKLLTGRPKKKLEEDRYKRDMFEATDIDGFDSQHPFSQNASRRLCKQMEHAKHMHDEEVTKVSTEKLLEASLISLETMGRRVRSGNGDNEGVSGDELFRMSTSRGGGLDRDDDGFPSSSYLRGAVWIGRNFTLLSEELAEDIETYRLRYLQEIADITKDNDFKRSCHRLTVIATTGINHTCSFANKSKNQTRDILEGLVAIEPGNTAQYQRFLATLPIDSVISASGFQKKGGKSVGGGHSTPITGGADSPFGRGKSPGRSIRFSGILDSPLFTSDLNKTPR